MTRRTAVDSSVWIDFLRGRSTLASERLKLLIDTDRLITADLVLVEVLQGVRDEKNFEFARRRLATGRPMVVCDANVALRAARNYRHLRRLGITVRKTIDTLIATRCILDDLPLLYSDRDFDPFVAHLGLRSALGFDTGVN